MVGAGIAMDEIQNGSRKREGQTEIIQTEASTSEERRNPEEEKQEKEKIIDHLIESDVDEVKKLRPSDLQQLTKTSLQKAMEYSYRLRKRAINEWLDAENLKAIGSSMEEYCTFLIEPLKHNKQKNAVFEDNIELIAATAVLYEQKKFLCHMVVYALLMRRWWGNNYHSSGRLTVGWPKLILLHMWTICDFVVFPVVFTVLYVVHKIVEIWRRKQEYRIIFLLHASGEQPENLSMMQELCNLLRDTFKCSSCRFGCVIQKDDAILTKVFTSNHSWQGDASGMEREDISNTESRDGLLSLSLSKVRELLSDCSEYTKKVAIVISDEPVSSTIHELPADVKTIAVGVGENICVNDFKPLTNNPQDVVLLHEKCEKAKVCRKLCTCIYGQDIYDAYKTYFITPRFIFYRDSLSYLVLLALHFVMCLQPSTLRLSAVEWMIMMFFIGRFVMEVDQIVRLRIQLKRTGFCAVFKYFSDPWNRMDVISLLIYIILLSVRLSAWSLHTAVQMNRLLAVSGYMYGLNSMVITLRVFGHLMEADSSLGTIQIALLQIIGSCLAILGQFIAALIAFSLAITKVYVAEISYNAASNVTSYGLCDVHGGITCWWSLTRYLAWSVLGYGGPENLQSADDTSDAIVQALYALFLIFAVVMLMNMMIALLSNTYQRVEDDAHYEWSLRKSAAMVTYFTHHPVPVPFNIVSLAFILARYLWRRCTSTRQRAASESRGEVFKRLISYLETEYIAKIGDTFSHAVADSQLNQTTIQFDKIIGQLNDLSSSYSHLQQRFTELNANFTELRENFKLNNRDVNTIEEKL